jgi:hypothetical protein
VKQGQFKEGDKVVYFPTDTLLPKGLSDKLEVTQYLILASRASNQHNGVADHRSA